MTRLMTAAAGLAVDRVVGDPMTPPHPVILMGRYIAWFDRRFNRPGARDNRFRGMALTGTGLLLFGALPALGLCLLNRVAPVAALVIGIWLIAMTIAWKSLGQSGRDVWAALTQQGLPAGQAAVSHIVGRDTGSLAADEVVRAAVETLAENLVDAIVAPVFFACLGGAPAALAYRMVNTLDAMVGHKTARHQTFGWASARLDDLSNWVPARLTALLMFVATAGLRLDAPGAWRTMRRDAARHPSPNGGVPEAMMAGALGVRLGGYNTYGGVTEFRAYLGDPTQPLSPQVLANAIRVMEATGWVLLGALIVMGGAL